MTAGCFRVVLFVVLFGITLQTGTAVTSGRLDIPLAPSSFTDNISDASTSTCEEGCLHLLQTNAEVRSQAVTLDVPNQGPDDEALLQEDSVLNETITPSPETLEQTSTLVALIAAVVRKFRDIPESFNHIEVDASYTTVWGEIATFPARRPRTFNVLLATTKSWLADALVQTRVNKRFDWQRSAAFAVFGFMYLGIMQWLLYVTVLAYLCPHAVVFANEPFAMKYRDVAGQIDLVKQVIFDTFLVQVFIYYPFFYFILELLKKPDAQTRDDGAEKKTVSPFSTVHRSIQRYQQNFWNDNLLALCWWIPSDFFVFAAPMYLRLPLDHLLSFFWTCLLSYFRGGAAH